MSTRRTVRHHARQRATGVAASLDAALVPTAAGAAAAWWPLSSLPALARRHGLRTELQRGRLVEAVALHVNAGHVDLDEANPFLHAFGLDPLEGPGR
jgi:hypothetical protein